MRMGNQSERRLHVEVSARFMAAENFISLSVVWSDMQ